MTSDAVTKWFSTRCVIHLTGRDVAAYEERITLWRCESFETAVDRAQEEANQYAANIGDATALSFVQAFELFDEPGPNGSEVFSLIRDSSLSPSAYLDQHVDIGGEHQGDLG